MRIIRILLLLIIFCAARVAAQTAKIDSLKAAIPHAQSHVKLDLLLKLCAEKNSLPLDTLSDIISRTDSLARQLNDKNGLLMIDYFRTFQLQQQGQLDSAVALCQRKIAALSRSKDNEIILNKYRWLYGGLLIRKNQYKEAITYNYEELHRAEAAHDTQSIVYAKNGIGWVYMEMDDYQHAIEWFYKSLHTTKNPDILVPFPSLYSNIGACENTLGNHKKGLEMIDIAIRNATLCGNLSTKANSLAIKSGILVELQRPEEAEKYLQEAISIRKHVGDPFYIVSDLFELANFYAYTNQCDKGIQTCLEGLEYARKFNIESKLLILYVALSNNYKTCGDYKKYGETLQELMSLKDSIHERTSDQALAEMQTKYDVKKKENIIIQQQLELTRHNYLIYGGITIVVLAIIISLLVFNGYRQRQRVFAQAQVHQAREEERNRIATELHDNIGSQLSYFSRKIEHIISQESIPEAELHRQLDELNESSRKTISDLRETIWALKQEEVSLQELADRIKNYANKLSSTNTKIHLTFEEQILTPVRFSSTELLNIFRICQEALNNAFRHSDGSEVVLKFESKESHWQINITDNGKGFSKDDIQEDHYGLDNMQHRAQSIQTTIEIITDPGKGTTIRLKNAIAK